MLRILYIIMLFVVFGCEKTIINMNIERADYYVAPWGDDNNSGEFDHPWATWQKAFDMVSAGDTILIRGGVYNAVGNELGIRMDSIIGTSSNPISIFNYPCEMPVLDCNNMSYNNGPKIGLYISNSENVIFKGIEIKNVEQEDKGIIAIGCLIQNSNNITFINTKSHNNGGFGFRASRSDTVRFINCDSYNNYDYFTEGYEGGHADGFAVVTPYQTGYALLRGCRSWNNSDDGYDFHSYEGVVILDSCWAFRNGYDEGDGNGFKLGKTEKLALNTTQRIVKNSLAVLNKKVGFDENSANVKMEIFNNTSYGNGISGFRNFPYSGDKEPTVFKNNLSYKDTRAAYFTEFEDLEEENNSWNILPPLTNDHFISLDDSKMCKKRQSDGSLPKIGFLRLSRGSFLIDAGIDIGLPYTGAAPDLGAYESE